MRKNKSAVLMIVMISLTFLFGFKLQLTSFTNFYYYQDQPFELTLVTDAIFVEFDDKVDQLALDELLSQYPELFVKDNFSLNNKKDFIFIDENFDGSKLEELISSLNNKQEIVNASPVFKMPERQGNPNTLIGVEKEIIAQFKTVVSDVQIDQYLKQTGMLIVQEFDLTGGKTFLIKIPKGEYAIDYANELFTSGLVNYSEPNLYFTDLLQQVIPNDPFFSQQWSHKNTGNNIPGGITGTAGCDMRTDSAWLITMGSPNVIVSIVDTGIDTLHEDLSSRIINGLSIDTYNNLPYAWDDQNHGTACAGIVAATGNNNLGVIGVAPQSRLFGVKIFNSVGSTNSTAIINGMIAAWQRGSWVSSNSWGGGSPISAADNAILDGVNLGRNGKGVVWSFATGNGNSALSWPSTNTNVLSVGGISPCNQRKSTTSCDLENWWGANYGTGLELVSPCVKIYTTDRSGSVGYTTGNYFSTFNGTSSATPNASGVAALMLAVNPNLTWMQVREYLCSTADKVGSYTYNQAGQLGLGGWNNEMGYGKINAYKAVLYSASLTGPTIAHTPLPNTEQTTGNYVVNCTITPISGSTLILSEAKLLWSRNNPSVTDSVVLSNISGNNFTGNIISTGAGTYRYFLKAKDNLGRTTTLPVGAPGNLFVFIAELDITPPVIVHTPLGNQPLIQWPVSVSASVMDNVGIANVICEYTVNSGVINGSFPMLLESGSTYTGTFDINSSFLNPGDNIEYRIKATDASSQSNISFHPGSGYHSFEVFAANGIVLIIDDDVTLQARYSDQRISTPDLETPLGASSNLISAALVSANYAVDNISFQNLDVGTLNNYDIVVLTAGTRESTMFNDLTKRTAIVNYTLTGGKTLVEGGEVGYIYRKLGTMTDLHPQFRRNILLDSTFVNDRIGANLQIAVSDHPVFNTPEIIPGPITINNSSGNGWGARDEMTVLPGITGITRIANWSGGIAANAGLLIYNPAGNPLVCKNIFFAFAVSQFADQTIANKLIKNAVNYLMMDQLPVDRILNLTVMIEGIWNGTAMVVDDVTVELRNTASPYVLVEQKIISLNSSGFGAGIFTDVTDGVPYFIVVKHRNGLETWSMTGQSFSAGSLNYDFTTASNKAYGNNLVNKLGKWCIYSGDVDQDGFINTADLNLVFTDNLNGVEGYVPTDLNGDLFTEVGDINIVFTNDMLNVERQTP